jgi:hypothetical protein
MVWMKRSTAQALVDLGRLSVGDKPGTISRTFLNGDSDVKLRLCSGHFHFLETRMTAEMQIQAFNTADPASAFLPASDSRGTRVSRRASTGGVLDGAPSWQVPRADKMAEELAGSPADVENEPPLDGQSRKRKKAADFGQVYADRARVDLTYDMVRAFYYVQQEVAVERKQWMERELTLQDRCSSLAARVRELEARVKEQAKPWLAFARLVAANDVKYNTGVSATLFEDKIAPVLEAAYPRNKLRKPSGSAHKMPYDPCDYGMFYVFLPFLSLSRASDSRQGQC